MKTEIKSAFLVSLCCLEGISGSPLIEDFSDGLDNWTATVILDAENPGSNVTAFELNEFNELQVTTTSYDGIEQVAYILSGAALEVGEEVQVDVSVPLSANRNLGVYVGGTAPVTEQREDYISVYAAANNIIATRGFDGTMEYGFLQSNAAGTDSLFVTRLAENTFEVGYYDEGVRVVRTTRIPVTPNTANVVGVYADVREAGTMGVISELRIISLPFLRLDQGSQFSSGLPSDGSGDSIGLLVAGFGSNVELASFSLVDGDGDQDNSLFQINANGELHVNADFSSSGLNAANGTEYFIRVRSDIDGTSEFRESELVLTLLKDDDVDNLEDGWELMWRGNLTDLSGIGDADFDGDDLYDIEEYRLSLGIEPLAPGLTFSTNPGNADTDGDQLTDLEEVASAFLVGARPVTDPTEADTDGDDLTDWEETNSGVEEEAPFVGTSGIVADTDGDGAPDGIDIAPLDPSISVPVIEIIDAFRNSSGQFVINFIGAPNEVFTVKKSTNLADGFVDEAATVGAIATDPAGVGQAVLTTAESSDPVKFYRIESES